MGGIKLEKQIIAFSTGGFSTDGYPSVVDRYILKQCHKPIPKICFLPHASDNAIAYSQKFFESFSKYDTKMSWLSLYKPQSSDMESYLLNNDIIYVGGGNVKSMLALWREWGLDSILKKAYENGIILCGVSAGAICWFDYAYSDSIPNKYTEVKGVGILKGILNVHQVKESKREKDFENVVYNYSNGYGLQDNTLLHFKNDNFYKAFSVDGFSKGYIYKNKIKTEIEMCEIRS